MNHSSFGRWAGALFISIAITVAAGSGAHAETVPERKTFRFANGRELFFRGDGGAAGVYVDGIRVLSGRPALIPDNEHSRRIKPQGTWVLVPHFPQGETHFAMVQIGAKLHAIHDSGRVIEIPIHVHEYAEKGFGIDFDFTSIRHAHKSYLAIRFTHTSEPDPLFVIREDGTWVRMTAHKETAAQKKGLDSVPTESSGSLNYEVRDGILEIFGCARRLDLAAFDTEAEFAASPLRPVVNQEGKVVDPTQVLKAFTRDLSFDFNFRERALPPSDPEAETAILKALLKPSQGSIVLLGAAGSGKTALVRGFLAQVLDGKYPTLPRTVSVLEMSVSSLLAGDSGISQIPSRIEALISYVRSRPTVVLVDEIHGLRGGGTHSNSTVDVLQMLKPALADGELKLLGTSTEPEFYTAFGGDPALLRRFGVHTLSPFTEEKLMAALDLQAQRQKRSALAPALKKRLIEYSNQFNATAAQPDKAIRLQEELFVNLKLAGRPKGTVTEQDVSDAARSLYQVDPAFLVPEERARRLQALPAKLRERIIGQDALQEMLVQESRRAFTGVNDSKKPLMRVLIPGPPGVGKTAIGVTLAEALGLPAVRIEMNRFSGGGSAVIDEFRRELAAALRKNPFTLFILDEFEKASLDVQNALLAIFDSGLFTVTERLLAAGEAKNFIQVSALNASFLLTTNAASEMIKTSSKKPTQRSLGFQVAAEDSAASPLSEEENGRILAALERDGISAPILDRITGIGVARLPTAAEFREILHLHLRLFLKAKNAPPLPIAETVFIDRLMKKYRPGMSGRTAEAWVVRMAGNWLAGVRLGNPDCASALE